MTHRIPRSARWVGAAALTATALFLTACGGSADGASAEGGKTDITVLHAPINYEVLYLAKEQGFFDEVGLNVKVQPGGTAQDNLGQLAGGSADIGIVSWDAAVTATAEGVPLKVISNNAVVSTEFDTSGVVVRKDSGISSMADLKGKTIAFNSIGTGGNVPVLQALKDAGLTPDDVTTVAVPYASMEATLENAGSGVDAVFPSDSYYQQITANEAYSVIANPVREYRGDLGITIWAATEQWLAQNGETAEKFNDAMSQAIEFYDDPANIDAVYKVRSEVSGVSLDDVQYELLPFALATNASVSQGTTDALTEFGLVDEAKSVDDILWAEAPRA